VFQKTLFGTQSTPNAMAAKRSRPTVATTAAFWDTSAIVPLCCFQPQTSSASIAARRYNPQIVWWVTAVEALSGFRRLLREKNLTIEGHQQAIQRLAYLQRRWSEIQPAEDIRDMAERLLAVHPLRPADSLQLAAALIWCSGRTRGRHFVCSDGILCAAAELEGFTVVTVQ